MKNSKSVLKWLFLIAAAVYVFAVIKLTFVKDGIRLETDEYRAVLFSGINEYKAGLKSFESLMLNYAGNVAMFLPLGIFLPVFFKKLTFWKTVWLGFLFSSMIELLQYSMSSGYMDVDDIITNTLGAALGAVIFFFVLRGKKQSMTSYILSFALIVAIGIGSAICVWRYAPNLLPDNMIEVNGRIAGKKVDSYDVIVKCYKMSPGDVFIVKDTAEDRDGNKIKKKGSYPLLDTTVFVTERGWKEYHVAGVYEMIEEIEGAASKTGSTDVRLWLSEDGKCEMILLKR